MHKVKLKAKSNGSVKLSLIKNEEKVADKIVDKSENIIEVLDKLIKDYKIGITEIKEVETDFEDEASYTASRLIKTFKNIFEFAKQVRGR